MRAIAVLALLCAPALAGPFDNLAAPPQALPSLPDIAERAVKSVVNIAVTHGRTGTRRPVDPQMFEFFFGPQGRRAPARQSAGSGVIVSAEGLVLTNNHVVQGASELKVTLADGTELMAEVVGTDPKTDIALIRVRDGEGLVPIELGDSQALRLGETVLAIGNPFGLGHTVTRGIVSAKGRAGMGIVDYEDFIQTDAAINPGNSGGALLDARGRLVGINTAILSRSGGHQGIGLAVPTHLARKVMDAIVAHGRVRRAWLGVGIQDLDAELAARLKVGTSKGVLVTQIEPGTPAAKAGLRERDVIVGMDGRKVRSSSELRNTISLSGPGKRVRLELVRDGETTTRDVELGEMPGQEPVARRQGGRTPEALDGLALSDLDRNARRRFKIPRGTDGALVTSVDPGSAAARAGLRVGDLVVEINRRRVKSAADASKRLRRGKALVVLNRQGRNFYLVLDVS